MAILIDGYNLLHASGILARNVGPGTLERAREGLVGFLVGSLEESERNETTIVFDAPKASGDLPAKKVVEGITILYAVGYEKADDLIAERIRTESAPRRLTVVSSDREIQRTARRRRSTVAESSSWYESLVRRRRQRRRTEPAPGEKPESPKSDAEVEYWMRLFADGSPSDPTIDKSSIRTSRMETAEEGAEKPGADYEGFDDVFPPDFGEDEFGGDRW